MHVGLVEPVCCSVIAVGGQEVVVELLEDVQHHSAIRSGHTVVRLLEHVVEVIEGKMFAKELVGQPVHFDQSLQLYNSCDRSGQHGVYVPTFTIHDEAKTLCKSEKDLRTCDVTRLKSGDAEIEGFVQRVVNPLANQPIVMQ